MKAEMNRVKSPRRIQKERKPLDSIPENRDKPRAAAGGAGNDYEDEERERGGCALRRGDAVETLGLAERGGIGPGGDCVCGREAGEIAPIRLEQRILILDVIGSTGKAVPGQDDAVVGCYSGNGERWDGDGYKYALARVVKGAAGCRLQSDCANHVSVVAVRAAST